MYDVNLLDLRHFRHTRFYDDEANEKDDNRIAAATIATFDERQVASLQVVGRMIENQWRDVYTWWPGRAFSIFEWRLVGC